MVLLPAGSRGHLRGPGTLRRGHDARMGARPQGTEDVEVPRKRHRAQGDHRPGRSRLPALLPHQAQRTLGGHTLPEGWTQELQEDPQHLLERRQLRIHLHDPGQLRPRGIHHRVHLQGPPRRGPLDDLQDREDEEGRDRIPRDQGAAEARTHPRGPGPREPMYRPTRTPRTSPCTTPS